MRKFERLSKNLKLDLLFDLVNAFSIVKTPSDTANFIQDVLTANEIRNLAIRLRIAKLLLADKSYEEIGDETKASSATITKVRAWIDSGGEGFKQVIQKLPLKYSYPAKLSSGPIEYHLPEVIVKSVQYGMASLQEATPKKLLGKMNEKRKFDKKFHQSVSDHYISKKAKQRTNSNTLAH